MSDRATNKLWTKFRSTFFLIGLCCSLIIVFSAFQVVVPYSEYEDENIVFELPPDIEVTPPTTQHYKKKRVIPPKKIVEKIKLEIPREIITEENVIDIDETIDSWEEDEFTDEMLVEEGGEESGKIEIDKNDNTEEVLIFPSRMPVFGNCTELMDDIERNKCSEKALLKYIYDNIDYPEVAKINGITGRVIAQIVVDKTGQVKDIVIARHPGGGLDKEVFNVLENMPKWQAGMNNFRAVNVRYTIPVTFELN
jgi:protein TonB